MATVDRYLLRQFLWVFTIFFSSFLGLFVVADSVNNFEEFSTYGKEHGIVLLSFELCSAAAMIAICATCQAIIRSAEQARRRSAQP